MRITLLSAALMLHVAVCPWLLQAQADSAAPARPGVCFRARPMPTCRGFWITEFALSSRLGSSAGTKAPWYATWELGRMVNTGGGSAFGATLFLGADDDGYRWGIRPRYRRWLSGTNSLELAAGVLLGGTDTVIVASGPATSVYVHQRFPGFTGSLNLNVAEWFGVGAQLEAVRGTQFTDIFSPGGTTTQRLDVTDVTGYAGVKLGSYGGAIAAVVVPIAVLIAVARSFE